MSPAAACLAMAIGAFALYAITSIIGAMQYNPVTDGLTPPPATQIAPIFLIVAILTGAAALILAVTGNRK